MSTPKPHFTRQSYLIESGQGCSGPGMDDLTVVDPLTFDDLSYTLDINPATDTQSGVVTTANQVFAGTKRVRDELHVENVTTPTKRIRFIHNGTNGQIYSDGQLQILPVANFVNFAPKCLTAPAAGDELCNKTYVDSAAGGTPEYAEIHMQSNTTQTTQTTGTATKILGTTTNGLINGFTGYDASTNPNYNRIIYDGTSKLFEVRASLSVMFDDSSAREEIEAAIYMYDDSTSTGTYITKSAIRTISDNDDGDAPQVIVTQCLLTLDEDDYIEVWLKVLTGGNTPILVKDLNLIIR